MIDAVDLWGESAVLKAARQGRKSLVEAMVKAGASASRQMQFQAEEAISGIVNEIRQIHRHFSRFFVRDLSK